MTTVQMTTIKNFIGGEYREAVDGSTKPGFDLLAPAGHAIGAASVRAEQAVPVHRPQGGKPIAGERCLDESAARVNDIRPEAFHAGGRAGVQIGLDELDLRRPAA